ncbi:uncharacterized protein LOC135462159 isoform X2 [Liolophura sinensis]|uniref:uncharacterized protein LOC135462159 isoform X2 n=1 Tax=Liolophura sinensis TaxID=3198878 RepID=UPI00315818F8
MVDVNITVPTDLDHSSVAVTMDTMPGNREQAKYCDDVDECSNNNGDCQHTCTNSPGSHTCSCKPGFSTEDQGKTCHDIEECAVDNGGCDHNCHNSAGSFSCSCDSGYSTPDQGSTCTDIDECGTSNGGCSQNCHNAPGYFSCSCDSGYSTPDDGVTCNNIDECATDNGGCSHICEDSPGSFTCKCHPGYDSPDDQVSCFDIDECLMSNGGCSHNCHNSDGNHSCSCRSGYYSNDNDVTCLDIDECQTDNGGCSQNCHNSPGSFSCSCNQGYNSPDNQVTCNDIDECDNNNGDCNHDCHNTAPLYYCTCRPGFSTPDNHVSCFDVDECATNNGGCSQNCHNTEGSSHCTCRPGYDSLDNQVTCFDIDECDTDNGDCSQTCSNTKGAYFCTCLTGYSSPDNGVSCYDVDECASNNGDCAHQCINSDGSYECSCQSGYSTPDQARTCYDIDECATDNGGCDHNCHDTDGSFSCTCRQGYSTPDHGFTCQDIDECAVGNGGCQQNCHNIPGSFSCSCEDGFTTPDWGVTCKDIDECAVMNGQCEHTCYNWAGGYECLCDEGYSTKDEGITCNDIVECANNNGGCTHTCTNTDGSFICTCNQGFYLLPDKKICKDTDECATANGNCDQICTNEESSYTCSCQVGYLLDQSDEKACHDIDECSSNNGGCTHTCTNSDGSFTCTCNKGYFIQVDQKTCLDIDECSDNNGGCSHDCENSESSYSCNCNTGFYLLDDDKTCQDVDECAIDLGGCAEKCVNSPGSYACTCEEGRAFDLNGICQPVCYDYAPGECGAGGRCRSPGVCDCKHGYEPVKCLDINECAVENGNCTGKCVNRPGSYYCTCEQGFYLEDGHTCMDVDECSGGMDICSHTCVNLYGSFRCECPTGYKLQLATYTCQFCPPDDLDCWPMCTHVGSDCVCEDSFTLHQDRLHCIASCPCRNGGVCTSGYPDFVCNCSGTDYGGAVCEVGSVDIPEQLFFHYGYEKMTVQVHALSDKTLVLLTTTADELTLQPSQIVIPPLSGGNNFTLEGSRMGMYTVDIKLAGSGYKLFEPPKPIRVLVGDVFVRLQLSHKQFPVGCFPIEFSIPSQISSADSTDLVFKFLSTSPWYKVDGSEVVFFTLGVPMTDTLVTYPVSPRGVEINTSDGKIRLGPISSLREISRGTTPVTQAEDSDCEVIPLSREDKLDFDKAESALQTLLRRVTNILPEGFDLSISTNPTSKSKTDDFRANIHSGSEVKMLQVCSGAPVLDHSLYHVFQFSTSELSLYLLSEELVLPATRFCVIVDLVEDEGQTVMFLFDQPMCLQATGMFAPLSSLWGLNMSVSGLAFSASGRLSSPLGQNSPWKKLLPSSSPSMWAGLQVTSESDDSTALHIASAVQAFFFDKPAESKLQTHLILDERSFLLSLTQPFVVRLQIEAHEQISTLTVKSADVDNYVTVSVGESGCSRNANGVMVNFMTSTEEKLTSRSGVEISGGSQVYVRLNGVAAPGPMFKSADTDPFLKHLKAFRHTLDTLVKSESQTIDEVSQTEFSSILETLLGLQHDVQSLLMWEDVSEVREFADRLVTLNTAMGSVRHGLDTIEDHLYLTLQPELQERLGFATFFLSQLESELNKLTSKLHVVTVEGLSAKVLIDPLAAGQSSSWGATGIMSVDLQDSTVILRGSLDYSATGQCCPGENFCDVSGKGLELQVSGSIQSHSVTLSSVWTKNMWQFVEVQPGAALIYGLSRKERAVKATLTDKVVLRVFGMDAPATVNMEDERLAMDSVGQVFGRYPAKVQLRGSSLQDADDWGLSAYVQLLLGEDSFPEHLKKSLNSAVQKNISKTVERLETAEENLKRSEFKLQLEAESLNASQAAYNDLLQELVDTELLEEQATAELAEADNKMYAFQDKIKLLNEVCKQTECDDQCRISPEMKVCKEEEATDIQLKYPCLVWGECLAVISNYKCHIANLVCYYVQKQVLIRNEGFGSEEFLQTYLEHAEVDRRVATLKLERMESEMAAQNAKGILKRAQSRHDLVKEVMEARQVEVDDLVNQKQSTAYLTAYSNTHSQNLFQVRSCAFGDQLDGMHATLFEVRCKINSLDTGWIWYTFNNDFAKTDNSLAQTAVQVFNRFHTRVKTALESGVSVRRKREAASVLDVLDQIATNSSLDTVVGNPGEQQWNDTCSLYKVIFNFLLASMQSLQRIVKAYVNEVILANERIASGIVNLQLNNSLSLQDGDISESALSSYGVSQEELVRLLASINPQQDPLIGHLINTSKILTDMNKGVVSAISHYDILILWLRQMDNLTALYEFTDCSRYQDCVKWAFDWYADRLDELGPDVVTSANQSLTEAAKLFILLIHSQASSMEEMNKVARDISQLLTNVSLDDILCGSKSTFADHDVRNISAVVGQNVTLACEAEGTPTPVITWWRIGSPGPLQNKSSSQYLHLTRVTTAQAGEYYCLAENYIGSTVSPSIMLHVGYPPEVTSRFPADIDLLVGDSLTLTCESSGIPEPKISWLTSSPETINMVNSTYHQRSLMVSHSGLHKCQAENLYGHDESNELYIRVRQATAICPSTTLKVGYIAQASKSPVSDTGVVVDVPSLEDYFSAAMVLIIQNMEGMINIRDLNIREVDHSIEFSVGMSTCENEQKCKRSACEKQYILYTLKVQAAIDALALAVYNDTYLFTKDRQAYYLNSALLEVQPMDRGCPSGHELVTAYVCASADAVVHVLPPENLRSLHQNNQQQILWDMNQRHQPFIQGYEVVLQDNGNTVINETVNTTRLLVSEDLAHNRYQVMVRAFTRSYYSDWVEKPVTLASAVMSESSYDWVVGLVVTLLLVVLLLMYLAYRLKKSHIGPSREASAVTLTSSTSGTHFSLELAPSKMKHFVIPHGVRGSTGVLSSDGSLPSTNTSFLAASESASRECIQAGEIPYYWEDPADDLPEAVRDDGPWDLKPEDITVGRKSVDLSSPR